MNADVLVVKEALTSVVERLEQLNVTLVQAWQVSS